MAEMMIMTVLHAIGFKTFEIFCLLPLRCQYIKLSSGFGANEKL